MSARFGERSRSVTVLFLVGWLGISALPSHAEEPQVPATENTAISAPSSGEVYASQETCVVDPDPALRVEQAMVEMRRRLQAELSAPGVDGADKADKADGGGIVVLNTRGYGYSEEGDSLR